MIVKMSKISIVGLIEERSAMIRQLMKLGVVELSEAQIADDEKDKALSMTEFDDATRRISEMDEELRKIQESITFLTENVPKEKPKLKKQELSYDSFVNPEKYKGILEKVFKANELQKQMNDKKVELSNLKNERMFLSVWEKLQTPIELNRTATSEILVGTIPVSTDLDSLLSEIDSIGYVVAEVLNVDKDQSYLCLIIHRSVRNDINEKLKENGFSQANFGLMKGTIADNIIRVEQQIKLVDFEIQELIDLSKKQYENLPEIQSLYDYIYNMRERRKVRGKFLKTNKTFLVGGWTPANIAEAVKSDIESRFTACIQVTEPAGDEETPVLLQNNSMVYPFEMITEMYSLPSSKGIDPNTVLAPFYWLFFGLMLSDAGYGVLLTLFCGLAILILKTEKGTLKDKMLKMLCYCGVSTIIWGVAFGGWFGDLSLLVFGHEIKPMWFNPNLDPMKLMIWSFIFGSVHLLVGMALNAYMLIRNGKWLDAIFDVGLWYLVLIGIGFLFVGATLAHIGKIMIIAGAIGLVVTQGRSEKNIFKKLMMGLLSLYNITGYISDVLSYSRLLALGLATGVIAQVVNQLAILPGGTKNIFSTIILAIILIGGHLFNMSINVLGAYVHSSRLQYVEFFGKFYESGGSAFAPLKTHMKYLKIKS